MTPEPRLAGARVLVTGATGFIGSRLAEHLAEVEGAEVTGIGRNPDRMEGLRELGVEMLSVDLLNTDAVRAVVENKEIVFHAAAALSPDPAVAEAVNVTATGTLAQLAANAGVRRFVHVSTVGVYQIEKGAALPESTPLALDHPSTYPRTKARSEVAAFTIGRDGGMEVTAVRPSQVYGPGHGVWTVGMLRNVCEGKPVFLGDGSAFFAPVHVDDVVDALVRCAVSPDAPGEAFNISDEVVPWREFMGWYGELCGREPKSMPIALARLMAAANRIPGVRTPLDKGFIEMATSRNRFPIDKARTILGWEPRVKLEDGMTETVQWLRDAGMVPVGA